MKKYIGLFTLLFGSVSLFAAGPNSISFVTTLSSPQGVFNQLDSAYLKGVGTENRIPQLRFCSRKGANNKITILAHHSSSPDAKFGTLYFNRTGALLQSDSVTGFYFTGSTPTFTLRSTSSVGKNVYLTVGRLLLNNVTLPAADTGKKADLKVKDTLYTGSVNAKVAKVENIKLPTGVWFPKGGPAAGANEDTTHQGAKWLAPSTAGLSGSKNKRCKNASGSNVSDANCKVLAVAL